MTTEVFDENVDARCDKIKTTTGKKGKIYGSVKDRLHSLKKGAELNGITTYEFCKILQTKHRIVLDDMIEATKSGIYPTIEMIDEILGDIIVYDIIMENLFLEVIDSALTGKDGEDIF